MEITQKTNIFSLIVSIGFRIIFVLIEFFYTLNSIFKPLIYLNEIECIKIKTRQ